ncbi:hypothetical protein [Rhodohalobacter sp.]|uniref:hypothetical protein n=1 Tax=Rhodohalobacter sp. TaxID=1974210 RepID=UPI002ACDB431|nr:hypothetical protein [Rhodohalobacter sp.]MDZ7758186.1 hypothetical protein [Rhodohalobacter sp.]
MVNNIFNSILILLIFSVSAVAQSTDMELDIRMDSDFSQEDLSEMFSAVIEQNGAAQFFQITAENRSSGILRNNFVILEIHSEAFGTILTAEQSSSGFFSLNPGGQITFSNLSITEISNLEIQGEPEFDLVITSNGRKLIQNLRRGYLITDDLFTLNVRIEQDIMDNRETVTQESVSFETALNERELVIETDREIVAELMSLNVSNEAPEFSWSGEQNRAYRLIIVDNDRAQNADALFSERFAREHSESDIRDEQAGVVLDVIASESSYQIPDRFAGLFEPGKTYAWQVQSTKQTVLDNFVQAYTDRLEFTTSFPIEGEIRELLVNIFGEERTNEFIENGLLLDQIQVDGATYSKDEVLQILREMSEKIENNQLKVVS